MRKVVVHKPGGYEKLVIEEALTPRPGKGEVLIEVSAIGVNFADCCVRMGVYSSAKEFVGWPITPGFEASGIVVEVGEGVTSFLKGDKVIALTLFGAYSTHVVAKQEFVIPLPSGLTFEMGASFPAVALTAYYGLFHLAHPRPKETILVHSAAGGVGCMLVQMGKIKGCRVVGVVGSTHKIEIVEKYGAEFVFDKSRGDLWGPLERFSPSGFDLIFDANGVVTLRKSYDHLAIGGRLVVYGFHTMFSKGRGTPNWFKMGWDYLRTPRFNPLKMTVENRSVLAFNLSYLFGKNAFFKEAMETIVKWIVEGKLKIPPIATYAFDDVRAAHQDLEKGNTVGKLVLTIG